MTEILKRDPSTMTEYLEIDGIKVASCSLTIPEREQRAFWAKYFSEVFAAAGLGRK